LSRFTSSSQHLLLLHKWDQEPSKKICQITCKPFRKESIKEASMEDVEKWTQLSTIIEIT
jgi:hypothetical protein